MINQQHNEMLEQPGVTRTINSQATTFPVPGSSGLSQSPPPVIDYTRTSATTSSQSDRERNLLCVVCLDEMRSTVLIPCGHLVACRSCTKRLDRCPICRSHISGSVFVRLSWMQSTEIFRIWYSSLEFSWHESYFTHTGSVYCTYSQNVYCTLYSNDSSKSLVHYCTVHILALFARYCRNSLLVRASLIRFVVFNWKSSNLTKLIFWLILIVLY